MESTFYKSGLSINKCPTLSVQKAWKDGVMVGLGHSGNKVF
jgi:hypothetical protein